jgi:hypothetical protein
MKKYLSFIAAFAFPLLAIGQMEIGVNGTLATTWLLNNNVSDQGQNLNPNFSTGYSFGALGNFFFTPTVGIGLELNMTSVNQKYDGTIESVNFDAKDAPNYFQLPILLKLKTPSGFYFEVGPALYFLTSAKGDLEFSPADPTLDYSGRNIETGLSGTTTGLLFGFGGRFPVSDHLVITGGLRFVYGLSDATEEQDQTEFLENLTDDVLGVAATFAHTDQQGNFSYEKTTLATGGLQIGLLYAIGKSQKEAK